MPIIGIDLGTTNSLAAHFTPAGPEVIPNAFGENLTPSVVSVDADGSIYVGKVARERQITHPENTAAVFKRSMGTKKTYHLGGQDFLPEELSSLIIKKLKEDAEIYLGTAVEEAIISTPAYFNDAQRRATKAAGELAGLKVERIVNEPTAAAIAYGLHEQKGAGKYLIFDLGGGTFDVSILEFSRNIMEVRAVAGDNYLGGEDFNQILLDMFFQRHGLEESGLNSRERAMLRKSAENAKKGFSADKTVTMQCRLREEELSLTVSLDEYEKMCAPVMAKLKAPIVRALSDASLKLSALDSIVLVGGGTRLPLVRSFVSKLFGRLPNSSLNPDEVVALGAAVQAAMKERNAAIRELVLTDVCPFTLGTSVSIRRADGMLQSGNFFPIIERNTVIPVSRVERLYALSDFQRVIDVDILQGESRKSKDNIFLGELSIPIPPAPAGQEAVDVRYTYDINGILEVEVTSVSTGQKKKMVIEENPGTLSPEEISARLQELAALKIHPREEEEYQYLLEKGERLYQETVGEVRSRIALALSRFEAALDKQDPELIEALAGELKAFYHQVDAYVDF
jgi:molecular chaperone HscC